jgi:hypothetical protein
VHLLFGCTKEQVTSDLTGAYAGPAWCKIDGGDVFRTVMTLNLKNEPGEDKVEGNWLLAQNQANALPALGGNIKGYLHEPYPDVSGLRIATIGVAYPCSEYFVSDGWYAVISSDSNRIEGDFIISPCGIVDLSVLFSVETDNNDGNPSYLGFWTGSGTSATGETTIVDITVNPWGGVSIAINNSCSGIAGGDVSWQADGFIYADHVFGTVTVIFSNPREATFSSIREPPNCYTVTCTIRKI